MKKKVCLLGAFGVGKTSLIRRFVDGSFSDNYLSTIGVKISRMTVMVAGEEVLLLIWDLAGEDEFQRVRASYMKGASGFLFVADGTRAETLRSAVALWERAESLFPGVPALLLINKSDLRSEWEVDLAAAPQALAARETSALSGENVAEAFAELAEQMVQGRRDYL